MGRDQQYLGICNVRVLACFHVCVLVCGLVSKALWKFTGVCVSFIELHLAMRNFNRLTD